MANKKKKSAPVKKSAPKKIKPAKKSAPKKTVAKKTLAKKSLAKKAAPKKKTVVKKSPAKKAVKVILKKITQKVQIAPLQAKVIDYSKAITPLLDRLVVRVLQGERVTAGGLIIPDTVSMMATGYLKAEVIAVGHGAKNKKGNLKQLDVQIGDHVLFAEHAGTKIEFNAEELQIIHESDVMGILQNSI
jgi:chaperonin GroES